MPLTKSIIIELLLAFEKGRSSKMEWMYLDEQLQSVKVVLCHLRNL